MNKTNKAQKGEARGQGDKQSGGVIQVRESKPKVEEFLVGWRTTLASPSLVSSPFLSLEFVCLLGDLLDLGTSLGSQRPIEQKSL